MKTIPLRESLLLAAAFLAATIACAPAFAASQDNLFDMADKFDNLDKQDFQGAIDRANACTRAQDFSCSESELAKAAKAANSGQDKKTLAAARQNVANEKTRIAEEARRVAAAEKRRREEEELAEERRLRAQREREAEEFARESNANKGNPFQSIIDQQAAMNKIHNQAMQDINAIVEEKKAQAAREAERRAEREAEQRRKAQRNEEARQSQIRLAQADARDRENQRRIEAERTAEQQRREREAQQQRDEQRRKDQQAQQERAQQQEKQRQREAQEKADKLAKEKADKLAKEEAEKAAKQQAQKAFLDAMISGIRLVATKCPDNAGHYYATGSMPKTPKGGCIDVYYEASCPSSGQASRGVAKNFIGMSGCFGDTYQIEPKPACSVKEVQIRVTDVRPGCN